jgi:uncharacterized membrane protein (DUF2068 family)
MRTSPIQPTRSRTHHNTWLLLIACFKLLEAALFIALGIGALHLIHVDIDDFLTQLFTILRFNPESHFVNFVLERASILDEHMLRRISAVVFAYASLELVEGIGLYLEKAWAEYLTVLLTASFLPFEAIHMFHRATWPRACLLAINALVLVYLLEHIIERMRVRSRLSKV